MYRLKVVLLGSGQGSTISAICNASSACDILNIKISCILANKETNISNIANRYDIPYISNIWDKSKYNRDEYENIINMTTEWKNATTNFNIFHYTKIDKSISKEEIAHSNKSKQLFDEFLKTAYPDRSETFVNSTCR